MNSKYDAHFWKGTFLNDLAEKFKFWEVKKIMLVYFLKMI